MTRDISFRYITLTRVRCRNKKKIYDKIKEIVPREESEEEKMQLVIDEI